MNPKSIHFTYQGKSHQAEVTEVKLRTRVAYKIEIYKGKTFTMAQNNNTGTDNWDCSDPKIPVGMLKEIGKVLNEF